MRLRTRLLLGLGYVVLLAIVALEIPLALSLSERVDNEVRTQADGQAELIAASAVDRLDRPAQLRAVVASAARNVRGRVLIVGPTGHVLADSASAQARGADYSGRPEIASALAGVEQQVNRRSETLDQELLATAVPIADGGRVIGAVRITQSTEAVHSSVRRTIAQLLLIGLAVLLIGLLAGAFIARQIALPVRRLERTARRVADGELSARADESEGSAEQRSLAASFNEMTARIRELLDAQRRFVADASHQLRTPLAGLRLRLEAASAGRPADRDLEAADAEVERLSRIVDDLLTLSRAGETARHASQCDLTEAAHRAAERFRAAAGAQGVRLRVVVESRGARCLCVATELDRALDALVENALLYGAGGGEVEIVVREGVLEVRDRGRGLAPGEEQEVFERFHRGSAARDGSVKGTGLGLAIARTLARGWGGEATLRAREGGGAVAALVVPPAGSAGPPPEEREEVAA